MSITQRDNYFAWSRKHGRRMVWFLFFLFLIPQSTGLLFAEELKFCYVDIGKVFNEYKKTKDFDKKIQEEANTKQKTRDALVDEIRRLRNEKALFSDQKRKTAQHTIEEKLKKLESFDQSVRKDLGGRRDTVMKEIFQDIDDALKRYGERKGYDIIFNDRAIMYTSPQFDKTKEVIQELNRKS